MRIVRRFFAAFVLTYAMALSIHAGVISTPDAPPQPAPTPATAEREISTGVNGDMHTGVSDEATAGDAVVAGALGVLQGVLSLL